MNQGEATQPTLPSHGDKLMSHVPRVAVPKVAEVPSKRKHEDTVDDEVAIGKKNKQENSNNDKSVIEDPIDLEEEINSKRRFVSHLIGLINSTLLFCRLGVKTQYHFDSLPFHQGIKPIIFAPIEMSGIPWYTENLALSRKVSQNIPVYQYPNNPMTIPKGIDLILDCEEQHLHPEDIFHFSQKPFGC
jgi:hypothetical protein